MLDEGGERVIEANWRSTDSPSDTGVDMLAARIRQELQHDARAPE